MLVFKVLINFTTVRVGMVHRGSPVIISGIFHENPSFGIRETGHNMYCFSSKVRLTLALNGGRWSKPHLGRFISWKDPVPIVQEAGWTPGPISTGVENLAPTGVQVASRHTD